MAFSTKIKGNHHLQGNVQVYNVRIPVLQRVNILGEHLKNIPTKWVCRVKDTLKMGWGNPLVSLIVRRTPTDRSFEVRGYKICEALEKGI